MLGLPYIIFVTILHSHTKHTCPEINHLFLRRFRDWHQGKEIKLSSKQLTSSLEDYIEVISNNLKQHQKVRAIDISRELNVSRASVSEALKRLADMGLINYSRYDVISITEEGEKVAQRVINRHNLLKSFFTEVLGLEENEAAENACRIEHVITENVYDKLTDYLEFNREHPEFAQSFLSSKRK